jgi:7-cyano-7-deazaguanine synthase in queuosine biosynthesis
MHYLFFSGGFDSTFVLLWYHSRGHNIQPVYILNCDNRRNVTEELRVIQNMGKMLGIPPVMVLDASNLVLDQDVVDECQYWYSRGVFHKKMNQFGYMVQTARKLGSKVMTGFTGDSFAYMNKIYKPEYSGVFSILENPVIHLTKDEMYKIAVREGYDHILRGTISCWSPINGKPCGQCDMCLERLPI